MELTDDQVLVCRSNISQWGRTLRKRFGLGSAVVGVALLAVLIAFDAPWWARLSTFLPAAGASVAWLQLHRNTCVALARTGMQEGATAGSYQQASEADVAASRKVAATIYRDMTIFASLVAAASAATALVR